MKYLTWKIDWSNSKEGTQPSGSINNETILLSSAFYSGDMNDPETIVFGYWVEGDLNFAELSNWVVAPIGADDFLIAAKQYVSADCTFDENGVLVYPVIPIPSAS